jgi:hypothetical protein
MGLVVRDRTSRVVALYVRACRPYNNLNPITAKALVLSDNSNSVESWLYTCIIDFSCNHFLVLKFRWLFFVSLYN